MALMGFPTEQRCNRVQVNPYSSPRSEVDGPSHRSGVLHEWVGHTLLVRCEADPWTLWVNSRFVVLLDGKVQLVQPPTYGGSLWFEYKDGPRRVHVEIVRGRGFIARYMPYEVFVDGKLVGYASVRIRCR